MRLFKNYLIATFATFLFIHVAGVEANPVGVSAREPTSSLRHGFSQAQACESEIDDDLTSYGECIGHATDRMTRKHLSLLGLYFQAWLIADLAARQGSIASQQLRRRYQNGLSRSLRTTGLSLKQLCAAKQLACEPVAERLKQKL